MTDQNGLKREMTVAGFEREMTEFIDHMKEVTTPGATGRARFPDFRVTEVIKEKVEFAATQLENENLRGAFQALDGAIQHFQNQQAAYNRRTPLPELKADYKDMVKTVNAEDDKDLVDRVRTALEAYEALLTGKEEFELTEASRLHWALVDALDTAEAEYVARVKKRAAKTSKKLRNLVKNL